MRATLWLALGLGVIGTLVFGGLTLIEPGFAPAELARLDVLARQSSQGPVGAVETHVALRRAHGAAYTAARIGAGVVIGGLLLLLIALGRRQRRALRVAAALVGAVVGGLMLLSPTFEMGLYGPPPPRELVMLFGLPAWVVLAAALLLDRGRRSA